VVVVVVGVALGAATLLELDEVVDVVEVVLFAAVVLVFAAVLELAVCALEVCAVPCTEPVEKLLPLAPAVVCEPVVVEACPWKPLAATTASAPDNVAAAATIPRVIARTRRRPASRARIARRVACSERLGVGVRRGVIVGRSRPARGGCRRSSSPAIVGCEFETPLRRA
jgi:hypothetical protein